MAVHGCSNLYHYILVYRRFYTFLIYTILFYTFLYIYSFFSCFRCGLGVYSFPVLSWSRMRSWIEICTFQKMHYQIYQDSCEIKLARLLALSPWESVDCCSGEMGHQTQRSLMACPWDRSCANNSLVMRIASGSSRECNELLCNRTLPFCQISGLIHVKAVRFEHFKDDNFISCST